MPILVVLNFASNKLESGIIKFLILPNDDNNLSTQIVVKHLAELFDLACFSFLFFWHGNYVYTFFLMMVSACVFAKFLQLCLTLCNPMDCSLPGPSVHGILQARMTGVSCHALLQGVFPTQESNPLLLGLLLR